MDKEKQIEEMAKDIVRSAGLGVHEKAKYLIDLGYTKIDYKNIDKIDLIFIKGKRFEYIPENAVVLTREEWGELKQAKSLLEIREETIKFLENANIRYAEALELKVNEKERKETAEKIYKEYLCNILSLEAKEEFAKEFGVDIGEE